MELKKYKDLDITLNKHPISNDIIVSVNNQAILRSVRNLILTQFYEKPFNPNIGSGVRALLFENITQTTASILSKEIEYTITNFEPRVNLIEVDVNEDIENNAYDISIYFTLIGSTEQLKVDFVLTRLR